MKGRIKKGKVWVDAHMSRCDWKVSKFFICHGSLSRASSGFVIGMLTCHALSQLIIFKVVQHAKVRAHVNFMVS